MSTSPPRAPSSRPLVSGQSPSSIRPRSPFRPVRASKTMDSPTLSMGSPVLGSSPLVPMVMPSPSSPKTLRTAKSQPLSRQALASLPNMPPPPLPRSEMGRPTSPAPSFVGASGRAMSPAPMVVKARVTPGATPRRKPLLPGTERADPPPRPRSATLAPSRPASPTKSLMIGSLGPSMSVTTAPVIVRSSPTKSARPHLLSHSSGGLVPPHGAMSISPSFYDRDPLQAEQPTAGNDSVFVCVRVKPCDDEEQAWVANPAIGQVHLAVDPLGVGAFAFDAVVTGSGNEDIYRRAARGLVASTMEGYDAVIFAYGQTASGKTYTLSGAPNNPGLIGRAVADVFAYIRAHPNKEFLLRASYLEIYNEQLRDLLADPPALGDDGRPMPLPMSSIPRIRQDTHTKRFFVAPLREEVVTAEASVHDLLRRGEQARHVGATDLNARSSRSHTVFQLVVESKSDGVVTASSLSLIDLAGSERATSQAERRAEGAFINRSLLTLEKVISALTEDKPRAHIPYRDSKLTQILQPSLSGDARVAVVCTIAPGADMVEESRSTLKFANRVKHVAVHASRHEIVDDKALITKYRSTIAELQAKLAASEPTDGPSVLQPTLGLEAQKQSAELQKQIDSLSTLLLTSANVDMQRDNVPRPVSPVKGGRRTTQADQIAAELADALSDLAAAEDEVSSLREALAEARAEIAARPPIGADASSDEKDVCIAKLMREKRELEIVLAARGDDPDQWDAAMRRERRLAEQNETYRKELAEQRSTVDEASRLLEAERKHSHLLESYILEHFKAAAVSIGRNRRRSASVDECDALPLPSLVDEEPSLAQFSRTLGRMSLLPTDGPNPFRL